MKKYEILEDDSIYVDGNKVYRIRALRDFADVKTGDLGGYVEDERNLSHAGDCWVSGVSAVYDLAAVRENAQVCGNARVGGNALIMGYALVRGNARVCGYAHIRGYTDIRGNAQIEGSTRVRGNVVIKGDAFVGGHAHLHGDAYVTGNAYITNGDAVVWFSGVGSECATLTVYCSRDGLMATRGCFAGTLDEFSAANAARPFSLSSARWTREYELLIEMARLKLAAAQSKISGEAER